MFNGLNKTVIGASHVAAGTICQDWSAVKCTDNYCLAIVADGHGSKKHFRSDIGSKAAVHAVCDTIEKLCENIQLFESAFMKNPEDVISKIEKKVILCWNDIVNNYHQAVPVKPEESEKFTEEELAEIKLESIYGSTLIAVFMTTHFCFGIQLGDGSMVLVNSDGSTVMPIEDDESCPANLTASLCNSNAHELFNNFYRIGDNPIAMLVSTDGLYTSFGSKESFEEYNHIIVSQLDNIERSEAMIENNLRKRTCHGSQDDISLSLIFDTNTLEYMIDTLKLQVNENKYEAEKKAAAHKAQLAKHKAKIAKFNQNPEEERILEKQIQALDEVNMPKMKTPETNTEKPVTPPAKNKKTEIMENNDDSMPELVLNTSAFSDIDESEKNSSQMSMEEEINNLINSAMKFNNRIKNSTVISNIRNRRTENRQEENTDETSVSAVNNTPSDNSANIAADYPTAEISDYNDSFDDYNGEDETESLE
ncbi:MAG: PP2C family serine/threonine-protein phosphatase [Oscillospiraceae bacterium]